MDVLTYSAFNQQVQLNQQVVAKTSCLSTKCSETVALQATAVGFSTATICWLQCIEPCLLRDPYNGYVSGYWSCIPSLTGASTGFKVCNTACQFNCGACCEWTVPAGVTRARFQLWGAGGGSGAGCCCGGSPFGSTGAYASVIIPVTAGTTYTLCSGCAFCCFANYSAQGRVPGCPSFVVGIGLSNFCANGGQGRLGTWMSAYGKGEVYRLSTVAYPSAGACFCKSGTDYCFSNSCATCGTIPHVPGASYFGTTTSATSPSIVYGIRGMWPSICFTSDHYGAQCHPPIFGFESSSRCSPSFSSGTCCGYNCRAEAGYLQIPGAGGFYSHYMGGSTGICGDMGRMGMVCVTYC